jgi:ATP-dependent helicase HepA
VAQWYEELKSKFILGQYLEKSVHVCGLRDATIMDKLFHNLGMLVLDEAHQLASLAESRSSEDRRVFNAVRRNALQVRRLLLLSATPALHNEKAFHTMLHLLDPVIYPLGEFDSFRKRVANRHKVAEVFHGLTQEASNYFLEGHLDTLSDLFPDDNRLKSLIGDLRSLLAYDVPEDDENRNQAVRAIRTHVSEVYRLHRRMLRNRRSHPSIEVLVAGRAGLERVVYVDRLTVAINETLEEWREEVITELGHDYDHHLIPVYGALLESL